MSLALASALADYPLGIAEVQNRVAELEARLAAAEAQCALSMQRVAAFEASTSWRVTAQSGILERGASRSTGPPWRSG